MARTERVNSVARAIDILRALGAANEPLRLGQIAEIAALPRSTVHRIVQSLVEANFIVADRLNGGFRLGPELARLASVSGHRMVPLIRPHLHALSAEVDEGASLVVLEGASVRFLDQAITSHGLRAFSLVGSKLPAHSTANGKALLADLPARTLKSLLPTQLPRRTEYTITSRDRLLEELVRVRERGVAFDRQETDLGISAIGCVIRDPIGNLAAVAIALPTPRFKGREDELVTALERTVRAAEHTLSRVSG